MGFLLSRCYEKKGHRIRNRSTPRSISTKGKWPCGVHMGEKKTEALHVLRLDCPLQFNNSLFCEWRAWTAGHGLHSPEPLSCSTELSSEVQKCFRYHSYTSRHTDTMIPCTTRCTMAVLVGNIFPTTLAHQARHQNPGARDNSLLFSGDALYRSQSSLPVVQSTPCAGRKYTFLPCKVTYYVKDSYER